MDIARKFLIAFMVSLLLLIACTATEGAKVWTIDGRQVPGEIIITHAGPEHCDWESASFLHIGSPLGTIQESGRDVNQYVRDPERILSQLKDRFRTTYDPKADLPVDAEYSGYMKNGVELWISQSQLDTAIYMVDGSNVGRWPKTEPIILCA